MKSAFKDRQEAGLLLAEHLKSRFFDKTKTLVLALPRGGVVVGYQVAKTLGLPLEVMMVEKIGHPLLPEFNLSRADQDLNAGLAKYRATHPPIPLSGKTVIVVDDGLSTGIMAMVAANSIKDQGAAKVILISPACAKRTAVKLRSNFEDVVCLIEPTKFVSIDHFYHDFSDVSEAEVLYLLNSANEFLKLQNQSDRQPADSQIEGLLSGI